MDPKLSELIRKLYYAANRIGALAQLAYRDLQGDGYAAMGYLDDIHTWVSGIDIDTRELLAEVDPELAERIRGMREHESFDWENDDEEEEEETL